MTTDTKTPDLTDEERFAAFVDEQVEHDTDATPVARTPTPADSTSAPAPAETKDDAEPIPGYNALSDEGRKAVDAALHERAAANEKASTIEQRYRAQQGQLGPTQRKAAELERQNLALLNRLKAIEDKQAETSKATTTEVQSKFKELYPEEAEAMEAVVSPLSAKIAELEVKLGLVGQNAEFAASTTRESQHMQKESSAVLQVHPDAADVINDPAFPVWVESLDEEDRAMVASKDAHHAIKVLNNFKRDKAYAELLAGTSPDQKPAETAARQKPRLDVEPNPRNRQSSAQRGNAFGSPDEEAWANFVATAEERKKRG